MRSMGGLTLLARASYLRNTVARRKSAPITLIALVKRVRNAEVKQRKVTHERMEFRRLHSDVLRKESHINARVWRARMRTRALTRVLGAFADGNYSLPPLVSENSY